MFYVFHPFTLKGLSLLPLRPDLPTCAPDPISSPFSRALFVCVSSPCCTSASLYWITPINIQSHLVPSFPPNALLTITSFSFLTAELPKSVLSIPCLDFINSASIPTIPPKLSFQDHQSTWRHSKSSGLVYIPSHSPQDLTQSTTPFFSNPFYYIFAFPTACASHPSWPHLLSNF